MTSTPPPARDLIVVDVETSGLDPAKHVVLEVCAINLRTGAELHFVPEPAIDWIRFADPEALAINRYYERRLHRAQLDTPTTLARWDELRDMLHGNLIAGANPWFDAAFLDPILWPGQEPGRDPHMRDLSTLAVGILDMDPGVPWAQRNILAELGIVNEDPHSALGDARACAAAFRALLARPGEES